MRWWGEPDLEPGVGRRLPRPAGPTSPGASPLPLSPPIWDNGIYSACCSADALAKMWKDNERKTKMESRWRGDEPSWLQPRLQIVLLLIYFYWIKVCLDFLLLETNHSTFLYIDCVCVCAGVLGTCVCGECSCHDVDPSGDWGDIHGDTCECDERNCHATYDRYTDDFCSGQQCRLCLDGRNRVRSLIQATSSYHCVLIHSFLHQTFSLHPPFTHSQQSFSPYLHI